MHTEGFFFELKLLVIFKLLIERVEPYFFNHPIEQKKKNEKNTTRELDVILVYHKSVI